MVPEAFHDYFVASTGAGAALGGLLFVAVSIAPERTVMSGAPVDRQAVATSAYTTLLNQKEGKILGLFCETALSALVLIHGFSERTTCYLLGAHIPSAFTNNDIVPFLSTTFACITEVTTWPARV